MKYVDDVISLQSFVYREWGDIKQKLLIVVNKKDGSK